jgi:hypothetical protein
VQRLIHILTVLLMALNVAGGVVAFVWLMIIGQWWAIGYGFFAFFAPFALITLAIPGAYLLTPALTLMDRGQGAIAFLLLLMGRLYEWAVFNAWFVLVFYVFLLHTTTKDYLPLLIWAFSMALAPWLFMAQNLRRRETGGDSTRIYIASAHLAYLAVAVAVFLYWLAPLHYMEIFAAVTLAGTLAGTVVAFNWHRGVSRRNAAPSAAPTEARVPRSRR